MILPTNPPETDLSQCPSSVCVELKKTNVCEGVVDGRVRKSTDCWRLSSPGFECRRGWTYVQNKYFFVFCISGPGRSLLVLTLVWKQKHHYLFLSGMHRTESFELQWWSQRATTAASAAPIPFPFPLPAPRLSRPPRNPTGAASSTSCLWRLQRISLRRIRG